MAIITISRQFGAGGLTVGKKLSEKLGYTFVDEEIIQLVAKKAKVSPQWVLSIEKEAGGRLHKVISSLIPRGIVDRILNDQRGYIDEEVYVDLLIQIISKIADEDSTVILGRGGQYILKGRPNIYHVLLISDMEHRIHFVETKYKLSRSQANQTVASEDKRRTNFYRKFNKTGYDQPEHYHLTLNMSKLHLDKAIEIIGNLIV